MLKITTVGSYRRHGILLDATREISRIPNIEASSRDQYLKRHILQIYSQM